MAARPAAALEEGGVEAVTTMVDRRRALVEAAQTVVSGSGYVATTSADIAAAAGLLPAEFRPCFRDKEDCFLAAYDVAAERVEEAIRAALVGAGQDWAAGVQRALAATADLLDADPRIGPVCGVEALFAGPRGVARRRTSIDRLVPLLAAGRRERGEGAAELPVDLERDLLSGAMLSLGRAPRPGELVPDLTYQLLAPYLGPAAARRLAIEA